MSKSMLSIIPNGFRVPWTGAYAEFAVLPASRLVPLGQHTSARLITEVLSLPLFPEFPAS